MSEASADTYGYANRHPKYMPRGIEPREASQRSKGIKCNATESKIAKTESNAKTEPSVVIGCVAKKCLGTSNRLLSRN